jgi:dimethylamine/trimethylamine dehydrogenase
MGEEWRRGWHPERVEPKGSDKRVLIVGAGPAGLECAVTLGKRGYAVALADAAEEMGGRINAECRLPGLSSYGRVRDWRLGQLAKLPQVELYPASRLTAADVREFGADHVVIATGSRWRRDGVGMATHDATLAEGAAGVFTPEEIMAGAMPAGPVIVYDEDQYYMGGCLAMKLVQTGLDVALVTPGGEASSYCRMTDEHDKVQARLLELGVEIVANRQLAGFDGEVAHLACVYTGRGFRQTAKSLVLVTMRKPERALYDELAGDPAALRAAGIAGLVRIGDCQAPGALAHAVHAGHLHARELDEPARGDVPYRRERAII